jgi:metallophosphoesterase (TIGR03768 family)
MKLTLLRIITLAALPLLPDSGRGAPLTTRQQTVRPVPVPTGSPLILPSAVSNYAAYGYSAWQWGPGVDDGQRLDLIPGYTRATNAARLLTFFAITDTHVTDKESPNQGIFSGYLGGNSSGYSPVMLSTTQVLDAAVRTINALHRLTPFDFGISLGDAGNSPQFNELRWFIDILDGGPIDPSSGAHVGTNTIDYQKPYQAPGLDPSIRWYQTLGNHDHLWLGSYPVIPYLAQAYTNEDILLMGDLFKDGVDSRKDFMGSIDGRTPYGEVYGVGPVTNFIVAGVTNTPKVAADPDRYALTSSQWMNEFFKTTSRPVGHGFAQTNMASNFACYSFVPATNVPIKVIVLDDTQSITNFDEHGQGFLDTNRLSWLVNELEEGQRADQLMIVAAHIPIEAVGYGYTNPPAVTVTNLRATLHAYPNLILWISGHRHINVITPQPSPDTNQPELGFWEVETASLRDFPQEFRTFEILRNTDNTVSILATDVDPVVETNSPAWNSRGYAVGAARIFTNTCLSFVDTNSYATNAELVKVLSPHMRTNIAAYGGPLGNRVAIDHNGSRATINYMGKLESADALPGPWNPVQGTTNFQYEVSDRDEPKFYRSVGDP